MLLSISYHESIWHSRQENNMALRIKSHWHGESERTLEEIAGALAFISWRIAQEYAINLHGQDFIYRDDRQRMDVIAEYVIFQLQIMDRLAYQQFELTDEDRQKLILSLAKKLAVQIQDNSVDLFGPGDYIPEFFTRLNDRGAEYARYDYTEEGPSYPFMRHLGYEMQQTMGLEGENRWVIDQVMDKDGLEVNSKLRRAMEDLFD